MSIAESLRHRFYYQPFSNWLYKTHKVLSSKSKESTAAPPLDAAT